MEIDGKLCDYGCGGEAHYYFKRPKKWCCENNWQRCPASREKIGEARIGKKVSDETKWKISKAQSGEKSYWYGKKLSDETKRKMSEARIGKKLSDEHKQKLSEDRTGPNNPMWRGGIKNDPYCPIFKNREWRTVVWERDEKVWGKVCPVLGITYKDEDRKRGSVHHISGDKQDCGLNNIIRISLEANTMVGSGKLYWKRWFQILLHRKFGYQYEGVDLSESGWNRVDKRVEERIKRYWKNREEKKAAKKRREEYYLRKQNVFFLKPRKRLGR